MDRAISRRVFSRVALACVAAIAAPLRVFARNDNAFMAGDTDAILKEMFGEAPRLPSDAILLKIPEIAEDGAIVPVTVDAAMDGVKSISLLVDANPSPLSATFHFAPRAIPQFKTRIKMGESSDVHAVVETRDAVYITTRHVKVTLGGCGG